MHLNFLETNTIVNHLNKYYLVSKEFFCYPNPPLLEKAATGWWIDYKGNSTISNIAIESIYNLQLIQWTVVTRSRRVALRV